MTTKTTIVVLSDPHGGEEALGRVFNALALAFELDQKQQDVQIQFHGTGTRWPALLEQAGHPVHALYDAVRNHVAGASLGCSVVFEAKDDAARASVPLRNDNAVPGTAGLASMAAPLRDGRTLIVF